MRNYSLCVVQGKECEGEEWSGLENGREIFFHSVCPEPSNYEFWECIIYSKINK